VVTAKQTANRKKLISHDAENNTAVATADSNNSILYCTVAAHELTRQIAGSGCQDAYDVRVSEVDDAALGTETLELGASVLGTAV